jgi:hypothetical protein
MWHRIRIRIVCGEGLTKLLRSTCVCLDSICDSFHKSNYFLFVFFCRRIPTSKLTILQNLKQFKLVNLYLQIDRAVIGALTLMSLYKLESVEPGVSSEMACFTACNLVLLVLEYQFPTISLCVSGFRVLECIKLVQQTSAVHHTVRGVL